MNIRALLKPLIVFRRHRIYPTFRLVSLPLVLSLFLPAANAEVAPFFAEYRLTRGAFPVATVSVSLKQTSEQMVLESVTEPSAPISWVREDRVIEQSEWHYHNRFPRPNHYRYLRSNRDRRHDVSIDFDWQLGKVSTTTNGNKWSMSLADKALDKALVQLALMNDLAEKIDDYRYNVADGGKFKLYRFATKEFETLELPAGSFSTLRVQRTKGKKTDTTLWMAPRLDFLPVRIDKVRDGVTYSMRLTRHSRLPD